jgi:hypothetical protein
MQLLFMTMPGGLEWIVMVLFIVAGIPFVAYRLGYNAGKKAGERSQKQA